MKPQLYLSGMAQVLVVCVCTGTTPDVLRTNGVPTFESILLVAFSPDGSLLGSGAYYDVVPAFRVWRTDDLGLVWNDYADLPEGQLPTSIAFAADNTIVGFGCSRGRPGEVVQVRPVLPVLNLGSSDTGPYAANVLAVSPVNSNPRILLNAGPSGIQKRSVFYAGTNVSSFSPPTDLPGSAQPGQATAIAFSPDAATFLLGNEAGTVQRWQVEPPQLLWQNNFPNNWVTGINMAADGRQIITLSSNLAIYNTEYFWSDVRLWEIGATNWLMRLTPDLPIFSTALTPDARYLFTVLRISRDLPPYNPIYYTNHVALWRVSDGRLVVRYDENLPDVQQVAVAPDGRTFAYGRGDAMVAIAWMPLVIEDFTRTDDTLCLSWWGGSGRYQVQQSTNLTAGAWENAGGPTTNTTFTAPLTLTTAALFYRVQSLTNAP